MLVHLRQDYFHEFNYFIPLGTITGSLFLENDAYDSFSEIFIQQEYSDFIPEESSLTILDIGANYGYFSLWIQSIRLKIKFIQLLWNLL